MNKELTKSVAFFIRIEIAKGFIESLGITHATSRKIKNVKLEVQQLWNRN